MNTKLCKRCNERPIATALSKTLCYNCHTESTQKMSASAKKRHTREGEEKKKKSIEDGSYVDMSAITPSSIVFPKDFDLEKNYQMYLSLGISGDTGHYVEKFAYAVWLDSDVATRTPKTTAECAKILGLTEQTVYAWDRTGILTNIRAKALDHRASTDGKRLWVAKMIEGMGRGDKECMRAFERHYIDNDHDPLKDDIDFAESELEEADNILNINGRTSDQRKLPAVSRNQTDASVEARLLKETNIGS